MSKFVELTASGVTLGAIYALVALGFLLLYKATGIFNFAQGDLMTLGAYLAVWASTDLHFPIILSYIFAIVVLFLVGVGFERVAYAPLRKQSFLVVVVATLGASIIIEGGLSLAFGSNPLSLSSPAAQRVLTALGAAIAIQRIVIVVVTLVAIAAIAFFLYRTHVGRQLRATADDRETAQLQGVRVNRLSMLAFGLSAALAALAGILIAPLTAVDISLGFNIMLVAFAAAIIGGFGSFWGVVLGGIILGLIQSVVGGYLAPNYSEAYPYVFMIIAIAIWPRGLFPTQSAERL